MYFFHFKYFIRNLRIQIRIQITVFAAYKKDFCNPLKKQRPKSEEREIYNLTVGELSENADYNPL